MKILYTYFGLMQRVGGVSRYFYENIIRIENTVEVNVCSLFCSNEYFRGRLHRLWFYPRFQMLLYAKIILEEMFLWLNLKFTRYDVVHLTAERLSAFRWTTKPIVITIHDMIPELLCSNKKAISRRKEAIYKCSSIVCVSNNTKDDLLRIYPDIPPSKVTVIYHGYNVCEYHYKPIYDFKYILYVGTRENEYKNFMPFVTSVVTLLKCHDIKLVCTGVAFTDSEIRTFRSLGILDYVICSGFVNDEHLANLYHFAECFVYPSKYEGFGIPILEAFSHQTPACISAASCFPEIGGDAVSYFKPDDAYSIYNCINRVLIDDDYKQVLIRKGYERLKSFSWDRAALEHIQLYNRVIAEVRK